MAETLLADRRSAETPSDTQVILFNSARNVQFHMTREPRQRKMRWELKVRINVQVQTYSDTIIYPIHNPRMMRTTLATRWSPPRTNGRPFPSGTAPCHTLISQPEPRGASPFKLWGRSLSTGALSFGAQPPACAMTSSLPETM